MKLPIVLGLLVLPLASLGVHADSGPARQGDETRAPQKETRVVTLDITGMT